MVFWKPGRRCGFQNHISDTWSMYYRLQKACLFASFMVKVLSHKGISLIILLELCWLPILLMTCLAFLKPPSQKKVASYLFCMFSFVLLLVLVTSFSLPSILLSCSFHIVNDSIFALPFSILLFFLFLFFRAVKNPFNDSSVIMKLLLSGYYFIKLLR